MAGQCAGATELDRTCCDSFERWRTSKSPTVKPSRDGNCDFKLDHSKRRWPSIDFAGVRRGRVDDRWARRRGSQIGTEAHHLNLQNEGAWNCPTHSGAEDKNSVRSTRPRRVEGNVIRVSVTSDRAAAYLR